MRRRYHKGVRITGAVLFCLALFAAPAEKLAIVEAFFEDPDGRITRNVLLPSGETIYFSFKVAGFRTDERQRVNLAYSVDCLDPRGMPVAERLNEKIEATLAPQDEHWMPKVPWSLVIPNYAPSGDYRVVVRVEDRLAKADAQYEATFKVRGETTEPEEKLAVRRFEFADAEAGPPKPDNVFHPGSTLWARFRLVGFKITADKEYWVETDLTVLDSNGRAIFSSPNAAVEKHKQFYPPRVLSTAFNLDLQSSVKAGEYVIRLDVRDRLGNQNIRCEEKFRVEP